MPGQRLVQIAGGVLAFIGLVDLPEQIEKWGRVLGAPPEIDQNVARWALVLLGVGLVVVAQFWPRLFGPWRRAYPTTSPPLGPLTSRIVGKTFVGENVWVDGTEFHECVFRDCTFHYAGRAYFLFMRCRVEGSASFYSPEGAVTETVDLLKTIGLLGSPAFAASWGRGQEKRLGLVLVAGDQGAANRAAAAKLRILRAIAINYLKPGNALPYLGGADDVDAKAAYKERWLSLYKRWERLVLDVKPETSGADTEWSRFEDLGNMTMDLVSEAIDRLERIEDRLMQAAR